MTTDPKQPEAQEAPASESSAEHAHDALPDDLEFLKARVAEHTKGLQQILDDFDAGYLLKCCASMLANRDAAARYAALGKQPIQEAPADAKDAAKAVVIDAYAIPTKVALGAETKIQRTRQLDGSTLWKVSRSGECLNKSGEWEWEPMPSGRDDEFLARCRFASAQEAIDSALQSHLGKDQTCSD